MNVDPFKVVGLISALFAIGDKVYTYVQRWRQSRLLKKSTKSGLDRFKLNRPGSDHIRASWLVSFFKKAPATRLTSANLKKATIHQLVRMVPQPQGFLKNEFFFVTGS